MIVVFPVAFLVDTLYVDTRVCVALVTTYSRHQVGKGKTRSLSSFSIREEEEELVRPFSSPPPPGKGERKGGNLWLR